MTDAPETGEGSVQDRISRYWSRHAESYDDYQTALPRSEPARRAWVSAWRRVLPDSPCDVLDVGAGTGYVSLMLAGMGHRVTGVDLSEGMLGIARRHAEGMANPPTLLIADAVDPPFPPASFDVVAGRYILWTLRQPADALEHWRRLLRPGGLLALVDSTWFPDGIHQGPSPEPGSRDEDFRSLYSRDVIAALPLAESSSISDSESLVRAAGYTEVLTTPLHDLYDLDRHYGVAPGHHPQLQFMITARAP